MKVRLLMSGCRVGWMGLFFCGFLGVGSLAAGVDFSREIQPILADQCYHCHGPDSKHRKAGLRLDVDTGLRVEKDGRWIVRPGDPDSSEIIRRIISEDPDEVMPPPESKKQLSPVQVERLRAWVKEGGEWKNHWAFEAPELPQPPTDLSMEWGINPVDAFVLARLDALGLQPSPEANRETLIRRVTLDLTGLPPTLDEVQDFVWDPSVNAFEKVVDRLLESPAYGERMALAWMDLARYGDSSVFHADGVRHMWPWRDWVIEAYSHNMPFDQFTQEQLAGDLMENATISQKVAAGFNRNHGTTDEGGAIDEEYRVEYIVDRVKTTANVWLGLSMECGQCHDHKYDPISQKEYYRFYAFFNNNQDRGMQTRNGNEAPIVRLFTPQQESSLARLEAELRDFKGLREGRKPEAALVESWAAEQRQAVDPETPVLGNWYQVGPFSGENSNEVFEADNGLQNKGSVDIGLKVGEKSWEEKKDYKEAEPVMLGLPDNSGVYLWRTVTVSNPMKAYFSLGSDDAIRVWIDGKEVLANNTSRGVAADQERLEIDLESGRHEFLMKIVNEGGGSGFYFKLGRSNLPEEVMRWVRLEPKDWSEEGRVALTGYYSKQVWEEGLAWDRKIQELEKSRGDLINAVPTSMTMGDMGERRKTYVLNRGHYASPVTTEEIFPDVPAVFPSLPANHSGNRLALAQWLTRKDHPLTARVAVNRYWNLLFGAGLVRTMGDFGTRGELPTHPELLDWLARDFMDHGWNIKRTLKLLVMSATYRQESKITSDLLEMDPENRWYARGARFRLQGEFIRDNALFLGGVLDLKIGGESVKPYQPLNIWNEVSLDGNLRYSPDKGVAIYRRSMYTYWKRSAPMPNMVTFDAPTREKCTLERQRTNTPLQALVTLNDVQFVEAARLFAERVLREGGVEFEDRLDYAFRVATGKEADSLRSRVCRSLYESQKAIFTAEPERAESFLAYGDHPRTTEEPAPEVAAWTLITSLILNLDEVLTKE